LTFGEGIVQRVEKLTPIVILWSGVQVPDILSSLKDGDSSYYKLMPERKNVSGRIEVTVIDRNKLNTSIL
jgi:hypothetical protein